MGFWEIDPHTGRMWRTGESARLAGCIAAGMDDYLPKPTTMTTVAAVLSRWVRPTTSGALSAPVVSQPREDAPVSAGRTR